MAMLDRYKKKGGFVQLLTLIETSNKTKQDQFLNLISQEDIAWEQALRQKMLSLDRVLKWPDNVLVEIFTRVQPLTLGVVFHGYAQENLDKIFGCMSNTDRRKLFQMMTELNPTPVEKSSCVVKLLGEIRGLIQQGVVKLEKFDTEMHIPENVEEKIHSMPGVGSAANDGGALVFPDNLPTIHADGKVEAAKPDSGSKDETEFLRKKLQVMTQENTSLRQEIQTLRNKLEQIRKIA